MSYRGYTALALALMLIVTTGCVGLDTGDTKDGAGEVLPSSGEENATSQISGDSNDTEPELRDESGLSKPNQSGSQAGATESSPIIHEVLSPRTSTAWFSRTSLTIERTDEGRTVTPIDPRSPAEIADGMEARHRWEQRLADSSEVFHGMTFSNETESSGITFRHDPLPASLRYMEAGGPYFHYPGVATADVNGDGHQDLYFVNQAGQNELWLNNGDGTFRNGTDRSGAQVKGQVSSAAAFGDVDNDGDPDLYVTTLTGPNHLFLNDGEGRFSDVSNRSNTDHRGHSSSAVFLDHNGDGLLDLYLVNLANFTAPDPGPEGYPRTSKRFSTFPEEYAESSVLYTNEGNGTFRKTDTSLSRGSSWDADAVLVPDEGSPPGIYVVNIAGPDGLYDNTGSGFEDVTDERLGKTPMGSFSASVFDMDGDGLFEIYVADKHSDVIEVVGGRVSGFDPTLMREPTSATDMTEKMEHIQGMGVKEGLRYDSALYRNTGDGYEISESKGTETFLPWGVSKGDLNADGRIDLFVTGGMEYLWYVPDSLLLNEPEGGFLSASFLTGIHPRERPRFKTWNRLNCDSFPKNWCGYHEDGPLEGPLEVRNRRSSRGSVTLDIDGDGDLDVVTTEFNGAPRVLVNDLAQSTERGYIKIELEGREAPRDGTGAIVTLETDRDRYHRFVDSKSYLAQHDKPLYFGLGEGEEAELAVVKWPSGGTDRYEIEKSCAEVLLTER